MHRRWLGVWNQVHPEYSWIRHISQLQSRLLITGTIGTVHRYTSRGCIFGMTNYCLLLLLPTQSAAAAAAAAQYTAGFIMLYDQEQVIRITGKIVLYPSLVVCPYPAYSSVPVAFDYGPSETLLCCTSKYRTVRSTGQVQYNSLLHRQTKPTTGTTGTTLSANPKPPTFYESNTN